MKTRILSILTLVLAVALAAGAGCKQTVDNQRTRYQAVKDRLDALATKNPTMREGIQLKLAEYEREFKDAEAKGGDAAVKAMSAVCSRMEEYERQLNPTAGQASASPTNTQPGGKLSGAAPPAPAPAPVAPTPVAPVAPVAPAPAPAAPGGSGFGGTPAPAPAPVAPVAPVPAPGGSGFGGQ